MASRTTHRVKQCFVAKTTGLETPVENKIDSLIKKSMFKTEDRITLIRYVEKKYRIRFGLDFIPNRFSIVQEKEKKIIDKHYDSSKRSYYVVKGKVSVCKKGGREGLW
jgi:hypothetical protein